MKTELQKKGLAVQLVVLNMTGMQDLVANLIAQGDFPILQDSAELGLWQAHNGSKDDFIVYDKFGKLHQFLPYGGQLDTALSTEAGWNNVLQVWSAAAAVP
jgi:hypothetical protein